MTTQSVWLPEAVWHCNTESYSSARTKYIDTYDLVTTDGQIVDSKRIDRNTATVVVEIHDISRKFIGFEKDTTTFFVLKSSITQLGVNAENCEVKLSQAKRSAVVNLNLKAVAPLGVLALDFINNGCFIGKLFGHNKNRKVQYENLLERLAMSSNLRGEPLLQLGSGPNSSVDIKMIDGRCIAFLPIREGVVRYGGDVVGLLPTVGSALKSGTKFKDLLRLHQELHPGMTRICSPGFTLMVRTANLRMRTMFGRVVDELLPKGLHVMSSNIIEPDSREISERDRTFVFYGDSQEELTVIPVEFYSLEAYREYIPFDLRKNLVERSATVSMVINAFKTMPDNNSRAATYITKGGMFLELTERDWVTTHPERMELDCPSTTGREAQQELLDRYLYLQPEYGILSAISLDDITSEGVLFCRHCPSPMVRPLLLSSACIKKIRSIFFTRASSSYGTFFSQEDSSMLGDLNNHGIAVHYVDMNEKVIYRFMRRPGMDSGLFVPVPRCTEYLNATFLGVYGSNLVAGNFENELRILLKGLLDVRKTATHPYLNPNRPLALVTGGGPGAMEVGNRVARNLGILSCGLYVDFGAVAKKPGATINEQKKNPFVEAFMSYRANKLVERQSDFNLDFPIFLTGGIGTDFEYALEEVRRKVGTAPIHPVILFGTTEHWGAKISNRYRANSEAGTIKGSEWISTVPWIVENGKEALEVLTRFFNGTLPMGPKYPANNLGYMVAAELK